MQDVILRTVSMPVGVTVLGPATVTSAWVAAGLLIDKSTWTDPADTMSLQVDFSTDSGATWVQKGGFVDEPGGGPQCWVYFQFATQPNNQRRVRATITVAGHPITATVTARLRNVTDAKGRP